MTGNCPLCGEEYEVEDSCYGRMAECFSCHRKFIVGQAAVGATVRCSHCGAKFEVEKTVGKLIKCKTCGKPFVAGSKIERPQKGHSNAVSTGEVIQAVCRVRFGKCPSLGSLLCRFPAVFRLMFRERYVIRCSYCSAIDVVYAPKHDGKVIVSCDCGHQFDVGEGRVNYLSWLSEIVGKIRRRQTIDQENERRKSATDQENENRKKLRDEFAKQLKIFEDDWLVYSDPKAEAQIARVKELTDRFYKKLSVANVNKLYHAQHTNTRLMSMYASNDSVVTIISGVAAWMSSSKDEVCEYDAKDLQKMIERNEQAVDYYYALGEEFAGKDKSEARDARLLIRVGYVQESDLPVDVPKASLEVGENVEAEVKTVEAIEEFVRKKFDRYGKAICLSVVIPLAIIVAVLFLIGQDHLSGIDVIAVFGFSFFIGLVVFCSWPCSTYEAASEEFKGK